MSNGRGPIRLGPMQLADVPQVVVIDRMSFPLPWTADSYRHELTQNANAHFLVAHLLAQPQERAAWWAFWRPEPAGRKIVGYIGFWYVMDEAHVSTLAVHPDYRRQKIGERLLVAMLRHAGSLGAKLATLEVRASNLAAQRLYRKYGFEEAGRRKGYYRDNGEDALLMTATPLARAWERAASWAKATGANGQVQGVEP